MDLINVTHKGDAFWWIASSHHHSHSLKLCQGWELAVGRMTPTKKGSWCLMDSNKKAEPSSHFCTGVSHTNCTSQRRLCWTACFCIKLPACPMFLPSEPALSSSLEFYFNPEDWGYPHSTRAVQFWPVIVVLIWPIRTVTFGPIKLWGFICMRMGQSGTRGGDFCPCKPTLLWLQYPIFPSYPWMKT